MGNLIEVNDTLQITPQQGFPKEILDYQRHVSTPVTLADLQCKTFQFYGKLGARIYHLEPIRVFLVENIEGKWLFWGHAQIQKQAISKLLDASGGWSGDWQTAGEFTVSALYDPSYQELVTRREAPAGKSYFGAEE
jgi:hypothetical protein